MLLVTSGDVSQEPQFGTTVQERKMIIRKKIINKNFHRDASSWERVAACKEFSETSPTNTRS